MAPPAPITKKEYALGCKQWPLNNSGKLRDAVKQVFENLDITIEECPYVEFKAIYKESEITCLLTGQKHSSFLNATIFEKDISRSKYKTSFQLNKSEWDVLEWAVCYRTYMKPETIKYEEGWDKGKKVSVIVTFEEQIEREVRGFLAELFLCKLFKYPFQSFWEEHVRVALLKENNDPRGDDGWDIKVKISGSIEEPYFIDVKTSRSTLINLGSVDKISGKPKLDDVLIAPVDYTWQERNINLTFSRLIDASKFLNTETQYYYSGLRIRRGNDSSAYIKAYWNDYFSDWTSVDNNPRYLDLLKEWPVLPLEPKELTDDELDNTEVTISDGSKHILGNLYSTTYAIAMGWI